MLNCIEIKIHLSMMNNAGMLHQTIKYVSTINIRFMRYKDRSKRAFATETKRVYRLIAMETCSSVARWRGRSSRTCVYRTCTHAQKRTLDCASPRAWPSVERLPLIPPFNPRHLLSETSEGERRNARIFASSSAYIRIADDRPLSTFMSNTSNNMYLTSAF